MLGRKPIELFRVQLSFGCRVRKDDDDANEEINTFLAHHHRPPAAYANPQLSHKGGYTS